MKKLVTRSAVDQVEFEGRSGDDRDLNILKNWIYITSTGWPKKTKAWVLIRNLRKNEHAPVSTVLDINWPSLVEYLPVVFTA